MTLTELTRAVGALRGMPAPDRRTAVAGLLPALESVAADGQVQADVRLGLLLRSLRAVSPSAARTSDPARTPASVLAELCTAVAEDRGPGRPSKGPPRTIRPPASVWDRVARLAEERGVSESDAAVWLIERGLDATP